MRKVKNLPHESILSQKDGFETTLWLCERLLEEINSPRSLSVYLLIQAGEWDQIANGLPIDAQWYNDPDDFCRDYQATKLLTKADFLPTSFNKRATALVRFESAESQCRDTNRRWRSVYVDGKASNIPSGLDRLVSRTKDNIQHILGRFPCEKLLDHCRWGPGATTSIRNPRTSVYEKYLEPVTGSGRCLALFLPLVEEVPLWKSIQLGLPGVVQGNKVVFVPKDAKTLRSIATEPTFNSFIQLGIGKLMRNRLLHSGVDLSSQELNRSLARYGSLTGKVATIDLSMASDTISSMVVRDLFPADWLLAMEASRSAGWQLGKGFEMYHKFSSMGNGYTFEMETILFYSAAKAVCDELDLPWWEVSAYGDDLTIGVEGVELLTSLLSFLGFTVNASKSFWKGAFRESCGKDFFLGHNVRPFFVRSILRDVRDFMKFHNGLLKCPHPFKSTAAKALMLTDARDRIFGPESLGDGVFFSSIPKGWFKPASQKYPMFEGFIVRHWVFVPEKVRVQFLEPAILASLYSGKEAPTLGHHILRKRGTWVTKTVIVSDWDDS